MSPVRRNPSASRWRARLVAAAMVAAAGFALTVAGTAVLAEMEPVAAKPDAPTPLRPQATMDAQQKALESLLPPIDNPPKPPPNVDPELWRTSMVKGYEMTPERIALGRKLYFDERLSADGTVSCATCHDVTRGFTDQQAVSKGIRDQHGTRNAPTSLNAFLLGSQFWDGRAATVEEQAGLPILNPIEMGRKSKEEVVAAVQAMPEYPPLFQEAFGRAVTYDDIAGAIGIFERTLAFFDAPFDRFVAGDTEALSADALAGWDLFNGKARCVTCHPAGPSTPLFSDNLFHNLGVAARHQAFEEKAKMALVELQKDASAESLDRLALQTDMGELGRFLVTRNYMDVGAFRTPQLRNVGITAPYMHDGSLATLWDVMDHYNKGGEPNRYLDGGMVPLGLTEEEIDQVVAFLFALTSDRLAALNGEEMARQRALAATDRPIRDDAMANREVIAFEKMVMTPAAGEEE